MTVKTKGGRVLARSAAALVTLVLAALLFASAASSAQASTLTGKAYFSRTFFGQRSAWTATAAPVFLARCNSDGTSCEPLGQLATTDSEGDYSLKNRGGYLRVTVRGAAGPCLAYSGRRFVQLPPNQTTTADVKLSFTELCAP